jgi:autotransporter adhesin
MNARLDTVRRDAAAGSAAAMAMAGMPQAFQPGKSMLAAGFGAYRGQSALAIGLSRLSDSGRWVVKAGFTADSRGSVGGNIGSGFHF